MGEIDKNSSENSLWVTPHCLEPTHGPYADFSPEEENNKVYFIVWGRNKV